MNQFNPTTVDQDEFEFKPLTEGLGFHKKSQEKPAVPKTSIKFQAEAMPDLTINPPLPRKGFDKTVTNTRRPPPSTTVDDILKTLNEKRGVEIVEKKKLNEPAPIVYKPTTWDLSASLLDAMLITAGTLLCLILLLVVTRIDLFANLYNPDAQGMVYWSLVSLVAGVTWIYLVANRIFLGCTPGEWVFDQRLGKPEQFGTVKYAWKAPARATAVLASGLIVIPLISFAMNQDVLGRWMGLELVKRA